jgi:hypothetical protein
VKFLDPDQKGRSAIRHPRLSVVCQCPGQRCRLRLSSVNPSWRINHTSQRRIPRLAPVRRLRLVQFLHRPAPRLHRGVAAGCPSVLQGPKRTSPHCLGRLRLIAPCTGSHANGTTRTHCLTMGMEFGEG